MAAEQFGFSDATDEPQKRQESAIAFDKGGFEGLRAFDEDGDGKLSRVELAHIASALQREHDSLKFFKRATMFLGVLVVLVAVALGGTTYVMVEDSIREPTTTTESDSSAGNATGPELVTPGGQQVAVAQSGQEVMLGMLKYLLEADPLQGIKAMPESMTIVDPLYGLVSLRVTWASLHANYGVTMKMLSGEVVLVHSSMNATLFRSVAAWEAWAADDTGNATIDADIAYGDLREDRFHFCAACVPIELKSLIHNEKVHEAFEAFDNDTKSESCTMINNYISTEFGNNVAHIVAQQNSSATYTPAVCAISNCMVDVNGTLINNCTRRSDWLDNLPEGAGAPVDDVFDNETLPNGTRIRRIVGGQNAPDTHRWKTYVKLGGSCGGCGGTLINPNTVITAAHCVVRDRSTVSGRSSLRSGTCTMKIGYYSDADPGPYYRMVPMSTTYIKVHSGYPSNSNGLRDNDIAIIHIKRWECIPNGPFASIKWTPHSASDESNLWMIGAGSVAVDASGRGTGMHSRLKDLQGTIDSIAQQQAPGNTIRMNGVGAAGACQGDSGGPLYDCPNGLARRADNRDSYFCGLGGWNCQCQGTVLVWNFAFWTTQGSGTCNGHFCFCRPSSRCQVIGFLSSGYSGCVTANFYSTTAESQTWIQANMGAGCGPAPPPPPSCHPAASTVEVEGGTARRMDALKVGDRVKTPAGFEPVVGFTHQSSAATADYIELVTRSTAVTISAGHYLVANGVEADPAAVRVGDTLTTTSGPEPVLRVGRTTAGGAFHLLTPSGTYYADGVLCTTFIAEVPRSVWTVLEQYAYLRFLAGVPVAPESADDGTVALDALYQLYHGKVPAAVEAALVPVFVLSGLLIELYNLAVLAGAVKTVCAGVALAGIARSTAKRV